MELNLTVSDILKIMAVIGIHLLAILFDAQLVWVAVGADLTILGIQVGTMLSAAEAARAQGAKPNEPVTPRPKN